MGPNSTYQETIAATLARAPDWLRQGLLSKEAKARREAEESLAAMIAAALSKAHND